MSRTKKFEDFFYKTSGSIEKVDTLIAYDEQNGNIDPYINQTFCPECYSANLSFVHGKTPHLRSIPSSAHLSGCSYNYLYAKTNTILEYLEMLTPEQVAGRLDSMMRQLMPTRREILKLKSTLTTENNPLLFNEEENRESRKIIKKAIRRQRLSGWIDQSIAGKLHIFYGDVKISSEERQSKTGNTYFRWIIKTENKYGEWKYRTSLYRGSINECFDENAVYKIVFIGTANFDNGYLNINLENRNAILYKELSY